MRRISPSLRATLILSLVLAVTLVANHWAVGRALARGAIALELCIDGGLTTVTLDASGNPVRHDHNCPDCVLAGLGVETPPAELATPGTRGHLLVTVVADALVHPQTPPRPAARGPPLATVA